MRTSLCQKNSPISDVLNRHIRHHHPEVEMVDGAGRARKLIEGNGTRVRSGTQSSRAGFPSSRADSPSARLAAFPSPTPPVSPPSPLPDAMVHDWELPHLDGSTGMDASCLEGLQRYLDECPDLQPNSARAISGPTIASMPTPMLGTFDPMIDPSLAASAPAQAADPNVVNHHLSEAIDFQSILVGSPGMADINPGLPQFHHLCSKNGISNEQFEQVRRLWPRRRRTGSIIPACFSWDEIVRHPEDNILSSPALKTPPGPADSFWGLTDACRDRLVEDTRGYGAISSPDRGDGGSSSASSCGPWNGELPPTDILDLCLDLYFSHFQVHLPFVHPGTFNASLTPSIFLFPMCLVGLVLLNKATARGLIATHIPGAIEHCRAELTSPRLRHCPGPELLTTLGAACLLLSIAAFTPELAYEELRQALYEETLSLARDRGLFSARSLNESLLPAADAEDARWKAWARIQSAQRLAASLILTDAYSAQVLGVAPILAPGSILIPLVRQDELFMLASAQKWQNQIGPDTWLHQPLAAPLDPQIPVPAGMKGFGLEVVLTVIWLWIWSFSHQMQKPAPWFLETYSPKPGLLDGFSNNGTPSALAAALVQAFDSCRTELETGNTNLFILWHYLGISLTTDLATIEDAAGRNGPDMAKVALAKLRLWARSSAARRACLHAAQIFVLITRHRRSDGLMLHTELALFHAALVMGFYQLTAFDWSGSKIASFDLFDHVDWTQVGSMGLCTPDLPENASVAHPNSSATLNFIQNGGPVSFRGAEYRNPYGAARRSFMNVAFQLEEVGQWNVQKYCKVLHIIADTLIMSEQETGMAS
ncbi:hypothetical protein AtubIFM55763_006654 [Aspergillus tubingensis]|uniref:Xylanolytic transcriptional activator regulatory domain-containing protein n=1 Tax=Aspergillus tubingensis TaxID=5068 RepID=A0A9W6ADQ5_ASPTU|nr:hypothetical protein AtubIFM54640_011493 [Aspergillus tubingensis]GLA75378.1 hypothetical protein AtubIFM55763_006654 [Aspergillus tubingensis]GLA79352.1 hypothetical protein AtubIFM56815_000146 [Aspergillus tubingensis]